MVLSSLFFLDLKGKILISRDYRGDISTRHAEEFIELLAERELELDTSTGNGSGGICNVQPPIFHKDGISYCYIKHNNLYRKNERRVSIKVYFIFYIPLLSLLYYSIGLDST